MFFAKGERVCSTSEELTSLESAHHQLATSGPKEFLSTSGCLVPCSHHEYDVDKKSYDAQLYSDFRPFNTTGITLSLSDTDVRVVRDAFLYGVDDLIGDLGGCLGMFLGISLVSIYQMLLDAIGKAAKIK